LVQSELAKRPANARAVISTVLANPPVIPESEKAAYRQLQRSIPRDATVMVRLRTNYALDFRHNNVLIADFPGTVSPPPGLPFQKGPEPLAAYLLDQGVRYVAFSYSSQADFTRDRFGDRVADDYPHDWLREEAARAFDFQSNLTQLGQSRLRIYDDGDNFVLDLTAKRKEPGQP
jgi:hypothetical protein